MKKLMVLGMIVLVAGLPVLGWAQEAPKPEPAVSSLDEMVVTASRTEEQKRDIAYNATLINGDQIRMSGATDLGDLLAEIGLGYIGKYPGALTTVGIRGFRTESHGNDLRGMVLVLLNGRRAGTGNVAKIMTKNIERIEIVRGPAAAQYGAAAIGGVINVITKQGQEKPEAFAEGILGSWGHTEYSFGLSGKYKKIDFSGSFTELDQDDYQTAAGDTYYNTGFKDQKNISLNVGGEFLPQNRIGVIYSYFDSPEVGSPSYLSQNDLDDYKEISLKSMDLIYTGATPDGPFSWMARYFDGKDKNKWVDPTASNPDGWDDGIPYDSNSDQHGAQAQLAWDFDNSQLVGGLDWVNYETSQSTNPKTSKFNNPALYLLGTFRFFEERFIVSPGIRYDTYDYEVLDPTGNKESNDSWSPKLGLVYLVMENLKLRANYGHGFKVPDAQELSANYTTWGTTYAGNPNLNPESSNTYEGGVDFFYKTLDTSITYFHTDFTDKIQQVTLSPGVESWENKGDATIAGFEGNLSIDFGSWFNWAFELRPYFNFVYLTQYKNKQDDKDLQYTPDITAAYGIVFSDRTSWFARLNVAYQGTQWINDYENWVWPAAVEEIEFGGFNVADLTISKKLVEFAGYGSFTVRGEILNLFDEEYAYVKGFPMPGRSYFIGLSYNY